MKYREEFELAKSVAYGVGTFLNSQTDKIVESSHGKDLKLSLDKTSENMILTQLAKYSDFPFLSEESGYSKPVNTDEPYWIIDPIDGSMNYSRDIPVSCISIALFVGEGPIFGVIYDFNRDEMFTGIVGIGAWLNDEPMAPSEVTEKSQAILATGFPTYMNDDDETLKQFLVNVQQYKKIRMIGSAALSLAYVACGRFDAYYEENIKIWDVAAGIAINRAVGNHMHRDDRTENGLDILCGLL